MQCPCARQSSTNTLKTTRLVLGSTFLASLAESLAELLRFVLHERARNCAFPNTNSIGRPFFNCRSESEKSVKIQAIQDYCLTKGMSSATSIPTDCESSRFSPDFPSILGKSNMASAADPVKTSEEPEGIGANVDKVIFLNTNVGQFDMFPVAGYPGSTSLAACTGINSEHPLTYTDRMKDHILAYSPEVKVNARIFQRIERGKQCR